MVLPEYYATYHWALGLFKEPVLLHQNPVAIEKLTPAEETFKGQHMEEMWGDKRILHLFDNLLMAIPDSVLLVGLQSK